MLWDTQNIELESTSVDGSRNVVSIHVLMQMHTVRTGKRTLVYRRIQLLISGFAHIVACVSVERAITSPSLTVHVIKFSLGTFVSLCVII